MSPNRRRGLAVLLTAGLALAAVPAVLATTANASPTAAPAASAHAQLAKPKMILSDTTIHKGQKVKVTVKRLPKKATSLYIAVCGNPPGATNCDQVDLTHVKQVAYNGSGKLKTKFKVKATKFMSPGGKINCKRQQCVIGTTNALNPADRSYNSWAKFKVVRN